MKTRYLLCYDVRDSVRLRKTAQVAEAYGYRVQYSIFLCDLTKVQVARLEQDLRRVLNVAVDRAMLVDLGPPGDQSRRRVRWLSRPLELYDPGEATVI